ncbi:MAG: hypothetical protein HY518_05820, partial [Candidatus Aenigmarchaeota archaeon]|nr:hypothetical protein [Candidatus Aenigmarchaeota archaeon]
ERAIGSGCASLQEYARTLGLHDQASLAATYMESCRSSLTRATYEQPSMETMPHTEIERFVTGGGNLNTQMLRDGIVSFYEGMGFQMRRGRDYLSFTGGSNNEHDLVVVPSPVGKSSRFQVSVIDLSV